MKETTQVGVLDTDKPNTFNLQLSYNSFISLRNDISAASYCTIKFCSVTATERDSCFNFVCFYAANLYTSQIIMLKGPLTLQNVAKMLRRHHVSQNKEPKFYFFFLKIRGQKCIFC